MKSLFSRLDSAFCLLSISKIGRIVCKVFATYSVVDKERRKFKKARSITQTRFLIPKTVVLTIPKVNQLTKLILKINLNISNAKKIFPEKLESFLICREKEYLKKFQMIT